MNLSDLHSRNYVPYSNQASACVIRSKENNFFPGVRVENASFPLTISAIQAALFNCISEGQQPKAAYVQDKNSSNINYWQSEYGLWIYGMQELDDIKPSPIFLDLSEKEICDKLKSLLAQARVAHSDFPVSALLKTEQGFISGVNVECSEWSYGLCAERIAISKAISYGIRSFKTMYIHTRDGEFSSPCGACRQVLVEHLPQKKLHLYHADGTTSNHFTSDLLPYSFHSSKLTNP